MRTTDPARSATEAGVQIVAVAPGDENALREWFTIATAARAHDRPHAAPPSWAEHRVRLRVPEPGYDVRAWLALANGAPVGVAELALPRLDNRDTSAADLVVTPDHRRRGVGRRLLTRLTSAARAAGRERMIVEASEPLDAPGPGALFLAAVGARKGLAATRRRLTLPPPDQAALDRLTAQAREAASAYRLVQWTGATPHRWLDDVAALVARMSTDTPLGDLHYGPEHVDAGRIRDEDAARAAGGATQVVTVAVGPDGRLAAYTVIRRRDGIDWHAGQGNTVVAPEHRGHRLGLLVKLANLDLLRTGHPAVRAVDTVNADANRWMVAINAAMSFRPLDRLGEWELDL